jgi:ubiquinone/menaquinone biosynthesis C-methylase UbiE
LQEVQRVLRPDGELIVVPHARLAGRGVWAIALRWLYAITGQRLAAPQAVAKRVAQAGLSLHVQERRTKHAVVTLWLLRKIA